jgi:hypothetical protein
MLGAWTRLAFLAERLEHEWMGGWVRGEEVWADSGGNGNCKMDSLIDSVIEMLFEPIGLFS